MTNLQVSSWDLLARRESRWEALGWSRCSEPAEPAPGPLDLPVGWVWATIDQLAIGIQYGTSAKTTDDSEGVPVLRMGNIVDGRLDFGVLKYLPADHHEFPSLLLEEGDILFNRTNSPELVGKTAVARGLSHKCSFASYLIRVRLAEEVEPDYVSYFLNSPYGREWIRSQVTQQVGQANVSGSKLRTLSVPLAPRAIQQQIVSVAEGIFAAGRSLEEALARVANTQAALRVALLHHAMNGRLTANLVSREPEGQAQELSSAARERQRLDANKQRAVPAGR